MTAILSRGARFGSALVLAFLSLSTPANAQRTQENVIRSAEDAFGKTLGNESIGIYDSGNVRGFSPSAAGNVRVEGLYVDQPAGLSVVVQSGYTVHIGPALQGMPFPAPTGVVNFNLRQSGAKAGLSIYTSAGPAGVYFYEVDGRLPIDGDRLSVAIGGAQSLASVKGGGHSNAATFGVIPTWKPAPGLEMKLLYNRSFARGETPTTFFVTSDSFLPAVRLARSRYFGPIWARADTDSENSGLIASYLSGPWTLRLGAFTSAYALSRSYSHFVNVGASGRLNRTISIAPGANGWAHSGEFRASRQIGGSNHICQLLTLSIRARDREDRYGDAQQFDYGPFFESVAFTAQAPSFSPDRLTLDHTRQSFIGLSHTINFNDQAEVSLGLQHTNYEKKITLPSVEPNVRRTKAWLINSAITGTLTSHLGAYGSFVTGFEEGGTAPGWTVNANEVLPAFKTRQWDAGLQWKPSKSMTVILGYFDIHKPYIGISRAFEFRSLGSEVHRGIEVSLVAKPTERLSLMTGGVLAENRVTADLQTAEKIGVLPVGQPKWTVVTGFDYQLPRLTGISLDGNASFKGAQAGTVDNKAMIPAHAILSLGARYSFKARSVPFTLRAYLDNIFNSYSLLSAGSQAYYPSARRTLNVSCSADF